MTVRPNFIIEGGCVTAVIVKREINYWMAKSDILLDNSSN
jgi:hypothetical protein